ncbi:MAG: glycosyltransferase family 2 protein [SAR324 cluster bacterium]|uniref:Glycosyltransferase family 2 protein n=1 Tax=SAR324 cluster bacterium TaxID=2024889 RepID=A0A7X9FNY6_9DELT|nr:glycosyltransferase family 2 protein [SAR324 cluster bacterium]
MISIVIPVFNEELNIPILLARLEKASATWGDSYEIIFVDDGSIDLTATLLEAANVSNPCVKLISLSRNFGQQIAISAGLAYATGDAVVIMDADLQDPPEIVHEFLEKWRQGYHVVYGIRRKRKEGKLIRLCYWWFYRLLGQLSNIQIPVDSGDFCVMDRRVVDELKRLPERNRFLRGLRSWVGFKQIGIEFERDARLLGEIKYTIKRLLQLALDGLVSFSHKPLKIIGLAGFLLSMSSFVALSVFFIASVSGVKILGHTPRDFPGYTTLTLAVLLLGGVQLLSLWIIGEYIGRIFDEVKQRPMFITKRTVGLG